MAYLPLHLKIPVGVLWRQIRWRFIQFIFVATGKPRFAGNALAGRPTLGPFEKPEPRKLSFPAGDQPFDTIEALNGTFSTPQECAQVPDCLWVEVDGTGECIRYYPEGFENLDKSRCLVFFSGDVMLWTTKGVKYIISSYADASPSSIKADMAEWSRDAGLPAVYVARPGIYGSSGNHSMRRRYREIALMDCALDQIKERHGISSFILAGQSGGGQIVAALLNSRTDIEAAVISSGLVSVRQVAAYWAHRREIPGRMLYDAAAFYDPVDEIERISKNPMPEIYIISDPEDRSVPFYSQLHYVRRLRAEGFKPEHIYAYAQCPRRHSLARHGKVAAALLAQGRDAAEIRKALHMLDIEQFE